MAKRKSNGETSLLEERAKLHHEVNADEQISNTYTLDSLPSSRASPERREKRKRTADPQSDTLEEVAIKRTRKASSEPPDSDSESDPDSKLWPSIGYDPSEEEPNWVGQMYERSHQQYLLFEKAYNENYNDPLSSPEPSESDEIEIGGWEVLTANPEQPRRPSPILRQDPDAGQDSGSDRDSGLGEDSGWPDSEVWPSIRDDSSEEEPDWLEQTHERSNQQSVS